MKISRLRILIWILGAIAILAAAILLISHYGAKPEDGAPIPAALRPQDATYSIDGESVRLVGGAAQEPITTGSAALKSTSFFGNEANGDINGDGLSDIAVLLTQQSGGSGTFYYVAVALASAQGYMGSNAVFLGDRIAPQNTRVSGGIITVNFAERRPDEDFSVAPSVGVSKSFRYNSGKLIAI